MELQNHLPTIFGLATICFWLRCLFASGFSLFFSKMWNTKTDGKNFYQPINTIKLVFENYKLAFIEMSQYWKSFGINLVIGIFLSMMCALLSGYSGIIYLITETWKTVVFTLIVALIIFLLARMKVFKLILKVSVYILKLVSKFFLGLIKLFFRSVLGIIKRAVSFVSSLFKIILNLIFRIIKAVPRIIFFILKIPFIVFFGLLKIIFRRETWEAAKSGYNYGRNAPQSRSSLFTKRVSAPKQKIFTRKRSSEPEPQFVQPNYSQQTSNLTRPKEPENNFKTDSSERKYCFACALWTGQRSFKGAAGNFIDYLDAPAKCSPNGGRPNTNMSPRATCNSFTKLG